MLYSHPLSHNSIGIGEDHGQHKHVPFGWDMRSVTCPDHDNPYQEFVTTVDSLSTPGYDLLAKIFKANTDYVVAPSQIQGPEGGRTMSTDETTDPIGHMRRLRVDFCKAHFYHHDKHQLDKPDECEFFVDHDPLNYFRLFNSMYCARFTGDAACLSRFCFACAYQLDYAASRLDWNTPSLPQLTTAQAEKQSRWLARYLFCQEQKRGRFHEHCLSELQKFTLYKLSSPSTVTVAATAPGIVLDDEAWCNAVTSHMHSSRLLSRTEKIAAKVKECRDFLTDHAGDAGKMQAQLPTGS